MLRSVATIVFALTTVSPGMPKATSNTYARAIQREAKRWHIDPFTLVAIFWHESSMRAHIVGDSGEAYGLGQLHARYFRGCDKTRPAANNNSASCRAVKANLLNPIYNIRMTAKTIVNKRKACRKITGRPALFHRWLASYGGTRGICGQAKRKGRWRDLPQHPGVREIIQCRRDLIQRKRRCKRLKRRRLVSRSRSRPRGSK